MKTDCDSCANNVYEEEEEAYMCQVSFDEDEMGRYLSESHWECPYFQLDDEYKIVRKQM